MKSRIIKLLIHCLVWYLDIKESKRTEKVEKFLSDVWLFDGFRDYVAQRNMAIKEELSGGVGMIERKRDDYIRYIGQRAEILLFAAKAKNAFEIAEKRKKNLR